MALIDALKHPNARATVSLLIITDTDVLQVSTPAMQDMVFSGQEGIGPGLLGVGGVIVEGAASVASRVNEVTFTFANNKVMRSSTGLVVDPADVMRGTRWMGAVVLVRAHVGTPLSASTWETDTLFVGLVQSTVIGQTTIEVRAIAITGSDKPIPADQISAASFNIGTDEGVEVKGQPGLVAPLCYGRFGLDGRLRTYVNGNGLLANWRGHIIATMLGYKVPHAPLVAVTDLHFKKSGAATFSHGRHVLLSAGSTWGGAGPTSEAQLPKVRDSPGTWANPLHGPFGTALGAGGTWEFRTIPCFSWAGELDQAIGWMQDFGDYSGAYLTERQYASLWNYYSVHGAGGHTTKTNADSRHYMLALQRILPDWTQYNPVPTGYWSGMVCAVALQAEGLSTAGGTTGGISFALSTGITNPEKAYDRDPFSYALLTGTEKLVLRMPIEGPRLGEVVGVRLGWLIDGAGSSARIAYRATPANLVTLTPEWNCTAFGDGSVNINLGATGRQAGYAFIWFPTANAFNHGVPQWVFAESTGAPPVPYAGEVVIWESSNADLKVHAVWYEVIYRPRIGNIKERIAGTSGQWGWETSRVPHPGYGNTNFSHRYDVTHQVRWFPYTGNIPDPAQSPVTGMQPITTTFAYHIDDGRYDTTGYPVENPASIAMHAIDYFLNERTSIAGWVDPPGSHDAAVFGSLPGARDYLTNLIPGGGEWRLSVYEQQRTTMRQFLDKLGQHSMAQIRRDVTATSAVAWRMFVDVSDFSGNPNSARAWRGAGNNIIKPTDIISAQIEMTSLAAVRNRFTLRYGYHEPTRGYAYELTCNQTSTTLTGAESNDYQAACQNSVLKYGVEQEDVIELPWLWLDDMAEIILKWHIDCKRDARVGIVLTGNHNLLDVEVGHYVHLDDTFGDYMGPYPGMVTADGATWSGHYFNVMSRTVRYVGEALQVDLVLLERWKKPPAV